MPKSKKTKAAMRQLNRASTELDQINIKGIQANDIKRSALQKQLKSAEKRMFEAGRNAGLSQEQIQELMKKTPEESRTEERAISKAEEEAMAAELNKKFDEAVALADAADQIPSVQAYSELVENYEQLEVWLEEHGLESSVIEMKGLRAQIAKSILHHVEQGNMSIDDAESSLVFANTAKKSNDPELARRVHIQSHLDGDPKPRPKEIEHLNSIRIEDGLDEMVSIILLPSEESTDKEFPGYERHGWKIHEVDGEVVCEPEEITITITDDDPDPGPPAPKPHAARHSHWEEVVDLQDEMIRFWYTPFGRAYGREFGKAILEASDPEDVRIHTLPGSPEWTPDESRWALHLDALERTKLQMASPMYVNEEVQALIRAASNHPTFKLESIRREDVFPNLYGFCVFPEPFIVVDDFGKKLSFRAISWAPFGVNGRIEFEVHKAYHPTDAGGVMVTAYTHRDDPDDYPFDKSILGPEEGVSIERNKLPIMSLCYVTPWQFDKEQLPIDMNHSGLLEFCKIAQTLWRLAQQTIVVPEGVRLPRAHRRRAERTGLQSDVVVLRLRKTKHAKHDSEEEAGAVEWSCRWIVGGGTGGFWRDQWYPKEKVHKQIWIMPFVKGPEDKPLVIKPLRAYELIR